MTVGEISSRGCTSQESVYSDWVLTPFSKTLPLPLAARLWDVIRTTTSILVA
jgi:hypothetical protein